MGQTSSLRFVSAVPRGVRVLVASADPSTRIPLAQALRADGHEVVVVSVPSELVFAMAVVDQGLGPAPDILVLDADLGTTVAGRLARGQVFLLLGVALSDLERHRTLVDAMDLENLTLFRKPLDFDDVRTAILNLETWTRARKVRRAKPAAPAFNQLTLTVEGEER